MLPEMRPTGVICRAHRIGGSECGCLAADPRLLPRPGRITLSGSVRAPQGRAVLRNQFTSCASNSACGYWRDRWFHCHRGDRHRERTATFRGSTIARVLGSDDGHTDVHRVVACGLCLGGFPAMITFNRSLTCLAHRLTLDGMRKW